MAHEKTCACCTPKLARKRRWTKAQRRAYIKWHIEEGKFHSIPRCCIAQFARDMRRGIDFVARFRWSQYPAIKHLPQVLHVPCHQCSRKLISASSN